MRCPLATVAFHPQFPCIVYFHSSIFFMQKIFVVFLYLCLYAMAGAQVKSPAEFLGYELGSKYTPHHKIVSYYQYLQQALSKQIKLQQYGETYEGRPLYLAFISSENNIANLEGIRQNNLKLAGIQSGTVASNATAIVWLSYNVHGNEPSSSEAGMNTIYELTKAPAQKWLANTVVIIDPCLNPDGRDRYVNWFNSAVGSVANANPSSREHNEPWPGGRTNHYNFDLNRDWAWQTQTETQSRIKVYNQWLPHVHVDYHEQGYNEPYYFAPAAEPFHEVITKWQRDFQTQIGKNNARYFDKNGWLYFTKERFDLFYPSYGDTYPTYNGSIGMTYEQGGHSRGGLTVTTDEGDTLTLKDRLMHHTITGLSTIETASENAEKLVQNFKKYFDDAKAGVGSTYKSYYLTTDSYGRMEAVKNALDINGIQYKVATAVKQLSGYNYFTGKVENVVAKKYAVAINSNQPKSILAKVLLEPSSKLGDSATYDITAWSIPYGYSVNAYGINSLIPNDTDAAFENNFSGDIQYGIALGYTSVSDAVMLAELLKNGCGVRINEKDITYNNSTIVKGSLLVLKRDNVKTWAKAMEITSNYGTTRIGLSGGFMDAGPDMGSPDILKLAAPKVACITGEDVDANAAGEVWHFFEQQLHYPVTMINGSNLRMNTLKQFDLLILPNGNYSFISDKKRSDELKDWVRNGGRIIAMESAVNELVNAEWGPKFKKADEEKKDDKATENYADVKKYGNRERDDLVNSIPGAIYKVDMDDTHPLSFGIGNTYYTLKQNGDVFEFMKDGWNVGIVKKANKVSGFAGSTVSKKITDGTLFAVQDIGRGKVIYLIDNPLFRSFWLNGKLLFLNAVFMVGNEPIRL